MATMRRALSAVALLCCAVRAAGEEEETEVSIDDLKKEYVQQRMAEGNSMHFSRMATPLQNAHAKRREFRSVVQSEQDKKAGAFMFTPSEREKAVQDNLGECLDGVERNADAAGFTYYDTVDCYRIAVADWGYNSTWWKRLGTLHTLVDSPVESNQAYNESVDQVFRLAKYQTKDVDLKSKGGVGFLKLFAHRDVKSAIEAAKLMAMNATHDRRIEDAVHLYGFLIGGKRADDDPKLVLDAAETFAAYGLWAEVAPLLELVAMTDPDFTRGPRVAMAVHMMAGVIDSVARRLLSVGTSSATKKKVKAAEAFVKKHCGESDLFASDKPTDYLRRDIAGLLTNCMAHQIKQKDTTLLADIKKAPLEMKKTLLNDARSGFMQETPLHVLATVGHGTLLFKELMRIGIDGEATNRFGQTPLHIAMGMGFFDAAKTLVRESAAKNGVTFAKDSTQRTPLDYACAQASWIDRREVQDMLGETGGEDPCDLEDEPLVNHFTSAKRRNDFGGWGGQAPKDAKTGIPVAVARASEAPRKLPGMKDGTCQIDVRDKSITGTEVLTNYVLKSRPVLIRGGMPNKLATKFRRQTVLDKLGTMRGRVEPFPLAEWYGGATATATLDALHAAAGADATGDLPPQQSVASLGTYMTTPGAAGDAPQTFWERLPKGAAKDESKDFKDDGVRRLAVPKHPLAELLPLTGEHLKAFDFGEFTFNAKESFEGHTLFAVGPLGAGVAPAVQQHAAAHIVPYGLRQWYLQPPPHAVTSSRHPLDVAGDIAAALKAKAKEDLLHGREALACQQGPGDILIVPPQWGAAAVNLRATVSITQRIALESLSVQSDEKPAKETTEPAANAEMEL